MNGWNLGEKIVAMGAILPWEIDYVRDNTHVGDHITFFVDGTYDKGKGIVAKKFKHHALCKVGAFNRSVLWVDVVRGGK